ncbi:hypothetical protein BGY98DRAFT_936048 [Russula aff. rugulosa BPL654]|nr:hypothetical protein BGY98DRAFT_936048 [Russula aff. rugulosa BPL654]
MALLSASYHARRANGLIILTWRPAGASNAGILLPSSSLQTNVPRVYAAFLREDTSVWTIGYIVMQYIDAPDCGERDHQGLEKRVERVLYRRGLAFTHGWFIRDQFVELGPGTERTSASERPPSRVVVDISFLLFFSLFLPPRARHKTQRRHHAAAPPPRLPTLDTRTSCLSVLGDRPVEPLSTRSQPRISFPFVFPSLSLFPYLDDSSTLAAPILSTAPRLDSSAEYLIHNVFARNDVRNCRRPSSSILMA